MKLNSIKEFIQETSLTELTAAQEALENHKEPQIIIPGDDSYERLTHVMIAIWVKDDMDKNHHSLTESMRLFAKRVKTAFE